ncbi:MAG TPA: protein kinase, partial [Steroidobacteraceae bacterium]|nr:protein kinase [Steroidobacteraceae bacterium]
LDAGFAEDGQPYLALEYVAGTPLTAYCDSRRCSVRERLELFQQVLSAVQYAHAHLIIHRDLKPSNILVTDEGRVQLLDFGIAKLLSEGQARETELTQLGGRALTPEYAAPEQIAGAPITTAADVYALGVTLYELLTGERPYRLKRDTRGALEEAILQAQILPPSRSALTEAAARARGTTAKKLGRILRGDLDTIAIKALKRLPTERYPTANALAEDLRRFIAGDTVLAHRDSIAYRALKFVERHRVGIGIVSLLFLMLAGGLAATSYEADIASSQRDAALAAHFRLLTETAAERLKEASAPSAMGIILEVLRDRGAQGRTPDALNVFQEARAADAQILVLSGHTDVVESAAFSPDGRRIVSASDDGTARVWSALTGRELMRLSGHAGHVVSATFSPDGRRIVTTSVDKTVRVWDAASGRPVLVLSGHTGPVERAAFSPDGERIVTASADGTARIWDASAGREVLVLRGHAARVNAAVFSPDGKRVLTAAEDKTALLWDAVTGRQLLRLSGHTDRVMSAAFSADGRRIVTSSYDKSSRVWDALTGQEITRLSGHEDRLISAAFSPDGRRVVTASLDGTARLWDATTGEQLAVLGGYTVQLTSAAFSPDGERILTTAIDKIVRVWDATIRHELLGLSGHTDRVLSVAFSPTGRAVATGSADATARIWDASTGQELRLLQGHTSMVTCVAFSSDGARLITASGDSTARLWDAATGTQLALLSGHMGVVWCAALSPDGRRAITVADDATARIWDAMSGQEVLRLKGHTSPVISAAFSPDGRRVVTASLDRTARIWDATTGQQLLVLSGHADPVEAAAFSPDGKRVITSSDDKTVRVWDAATGDQLMLLSGHASIVGSVAFSRDNRRILTASYDRTARIWDAESGRQLLLLTGHTDLVESAQFSPDGERVITASDDKTARIWDARVASLDAQLTWAEAAQFAALTAEERFALGLPSSTDVRQWPATSSKCDQSAAAPYDPDRRAAGVMLDGIVPDIALPACRRLVSGRDKARFAYQYGRALMASGEFSAARGELEAAVAGGYKAARIELAMLLSEPSAGMLDVGRAASLYEQASSEGVTMGAFELGRLYERGVIKSDRTDGPYLLMPDQARAWSWYRKAGQAGQPNALARLAENDLDAISAQERRERGSDYLLQAFTHYASAAEQARREGWPDDAWSAWRYGRASLARLLAREGRMEEVAQRYAAVRSFVARPPSPWSRLLSRLQMRR